MAVKKTTTRKSPKRVAAGKKAARTRKRTASTTPKRRRRTTKPKGFLSQIGGVEGRNAFRTLTSGAVGGTLYLVYEDQVDIQNMTPEKKGAIAAVGAYALAVMGKKPNVAAGIIGAAAYDFFKEKGLLDDPMNTQMNRMKYADPLQNIPTMLSDDNMMLASNNEQMYLSQNGQDMYLQDDQYLPDYAATYRY